MKPDMVFVCYATTACTVTLSVTRARLAAKLKHLKRRKLRARVYEILSSGDKGAEITGVCK